MPEFDELADLHRTIKEQNVLIRAIGGAMFSLFDFLTDVLEKEKVAKRSEIATRLKEIVGREKAATEQTERERDALRTLPLEARQPWSDLEAQKKQHELLEAFISRLPLPPPPSPPKPSGRRLRAIEGGKGRRAK